MMTRDRSSDRRFAFRFVASMVMASAATGVMTSAASAAVSPYGLVGSFTLPSSDAQFDVGNDGRVVAVQASGVISVQSAPSSSTFAPLASISSSLLPSFGAGFASLSPDGSRLAISDNGVANQMHVVNLPAVFTPGNLSPLSVSVPAFAAAWSSGSTLYVSGSPDFSTPPSLRRVDLTGPTVTQVVTGLGSGAGGVAVRAGSIYTGVGFGAGEGDVRSFSQSALDSASASVAFTTGSLVANAYSASTVDFDAAGNIIIAGGIFGGAAGVAVIDPVTNERYELPGLSSTGFYSATFNAFASEILVRDFGSTTVLRFAIPAPGGFGMLAIAGVFASRRRRTSSRMGVAA